MHLVEYVFLLRPLNVVTTLAFAIDDGDIDGVDVSVVLLSLWLTPLP